MNTLSDVYMIHLYYYNCIHPTTWCISLLQIALNDSFPKQATQGHVYFFCLKYQLHLCLSQSVEQITAYFPDLPEDHLNISTGKNIAI